MTPVPDSQSQDPPSSGPGSRRRSRRVQREINGIDASFNSPSIQQSGTSPREQTESPTRPSNSDPEDILGSLQEMGAVEYVRQNLVNVIKTKRKRCQLKNYFLIAIHWFLINTGSSYTEHEEEEKTRLVDLFAAKIRNGGGIAAGDLRSLEIILRAPDMAFAEREDWPLRTCVDMLEKDLGQKFTSTLNPAGLRFLWVALRILISHGNVTSLGDEVHDEIERLDSMAIPSKHQAKRELLRKSLHFLRIRSKLSMHPSSSSRGRTARLPVGKYKSNRQKYDSRRSASRESGGHGDSADSENSEDPEDLEDLEAHGDFQNDDNHKVSNTSDSSAISLSLDPPSSLTSMLLDIYMKREHTFLPILELPVLESYRHAVQIERTDISSSEMAVLNFCYAIASVHPPRPIPRDNSMPANRQIPGGSKFYKNAQFLKVQNKSPDNSLILIQCNALQAQYLWATGQLRDAQSASPMRAIQNMLTASCKEDTRETEFLTRLWHSIWIIERAIFIDVGEIPPSMFDRSKKLLSEGSWSSEGTNRHQIKYFEVNGELYQRIDKLVMNDEHLRLGEHQCFRSKLNDLQISQVPGLNQQRGLKPLLESIQSLKDMTNPLPSESEHHLAFRIRHQYFVMRAYRPFFVLNIANSVRCIVCDSSAPHVLTQNLTSHGDASPVSDVQRAANYCVESAMQVLKLIFEHRGQKTSVRNYASSSTPCEDLHHLYVCGLIFVGIIMLPLSSSIGIEQQQLAETNYAKVAELLDMHAQNANDDKLRKKFSRCRDILKTFSELAMRVRNDTSKSSIEVLQGVKIERDPRCGIYRRLRDPPRYSNENAPTTDSWDLILGWLESLPSDIED
ncbi:hypothetical protein N7456_004038 [Penicillium angulare]|uniref:Transcription factor domain-containing protein n=1 Tax=Penicillium angulare TaxID=116970 RepID=A0A9W9FVU9_9EURO|nr:hypothetical protein N7456_004038 [Penicillium angulare]